MKLDLDTLEYGMSEINISGSLKLSLGEGRPDTATLGGALEVQDLDSRVLLNGTLQAEGTVECGRCLNDFSLKWKVPVTITVLRDVVEEEEEGEALLIVQSRGLADLYPSLRECAVLAYPQGAMCRESCKGLCVTCGVDLNLEACDCQSEDYDPRWEGLPD